MVKRLIAFLVMAIIIFALMACGGHRRSLLLDQELAPGSTGLAGADQSLPAFNQLPDPQRQLSTVGPGFFDVPIDEMVARAGTSGAPGSVTVGTGGLGYVIYGVFGFDGDNGPTSARITASSVTGEYFVGFSDYLSGEWSFAGPFTDSAEVEIPNTDEYTSPTAFTSPTGTCYLAVVCSAGNNATLTGVALGVQGGTLGPEPPLSFDATGDAPKFFLQWTNSNSYQDPDFAGYVLQRAPLLEGDFSDLYPDPLEEPYFNDSTAVSDEVYRYRLCSQDASGNRSVWRTLVDGPISGEKSLPVLRLDMPLGPLHGPVGVNFDLGGSFDPEGEGITTYTLVFLTGPAPVSGPGSSFNVELQPGCYTVIAQVECAGPPVRDSTNTFRLIVYPRWQASPVVVREPEAPTLLDVRRLLMAGGSYNSLAQRITLCGIDVTNIGLCFYTAPASNPADLTIRRLPVYLFPLGASDTLEVGNSTFYAVASASNITLAQFDGSALTQQIFDFNPDSGKVAAVFDGSQIWLVFDHFDGLNTNLRFEPTVTGSGFDAVAATGALSALDALFNPDSGTVDVVYGAPGTATTEWVRVDTATAAVVDSANLDAAAAAVDVDLELDPGTGRPLVLYSHTSIHRFRELDEFNVWTPEVQVDNAVMNFTPLDLVVDDGTRYAYFRTGPAGQAVLYRDDGGAWSAVNTVGFSADSGIEVALIPRPGGADRALVLDMDFSRDYHLAQLHDDGTDTDIWQLPHGDGQGFDLHTAAGTDGLHAVWRSFSTIQTRHAVSPDGETWNDPGDIGMSYADCGLAADLSGDVYFSCFHAGNSELYWWNGAAWQLRASFPSATADHKPFFSSPPATSVTWCAYENGITTMHYVDANEPAYVDNPIVMTTAPVWDGVANTAGTSIDYWVGLVGGATPADGQMCWSEVGLNYVSSIFEPLFGGLLEIYGSPINWGNNFATTSYIGELPIGLEQTIFSVRGKLLNPIRYTPHFYGTPELDEIAVGKDYTLFAIEDLFQEDVRNTVSCAFAYSATGLVLISSADGTRSYFAWSRYGDWEELPLPADLDYMSMPSLVVGLDGRWHIVYKNWRTDQMMCLSTVAP